VTAKKLEFKQARAERTYHAIVDAAARVFPKKGFEKTQAPDIARAAGISVGAIYRYFDDKREIFLVMLKEHLDRARNEVAIQLSPPQFTFDDPKVALVHVLDVLFDQIGKDPALAKVYLAMSLTDREVAKIREEAEIYDRQFIANMIEMGIPRERIPDPHAAALVIERAVTGAAIDCIVGSKTVSQEAAKAALHAMIVRYLFGEA